MSKIVITRPAEWVNKWRKYRLILDEQPLAEIKNDQILEFEVSPGRYILRATIDWTGSNIYEFEIAEGETRYITLSTFRNANWLIPSGSILILSYMLVLRRLFQLKDTIWEKIYWAVLLFYAGIFLYYLTLGRKKYLWLRADNK